MGCHKQNACMLAATTLITRQRRTLPRNLTILHYSVRHYRGDFPNQNPCVDGLSVWTERDAPLRNQDIVVWHVFGMTHVRLLLLSVNVNTCHLSLIVM